MGPSCDSLLIRRVFLLHQQLPQGEATDVATGIVLLEHQCENAGHFTLMKVNVISLCVELLECRALERSQCKVDTDNLLSRSLLIYSFITSLLHGSRLCSWHHPLSLLFQKLIAIKIAKRELKTRHLRYHLLSFLSQLLCKFNSLTFVLNFDILARKYFFLTLILIVASLGSLRFLILLAQSEVEATAIWLLLIVLHLNIFIL